MSDTAIRRQLENICRIFRIDGVLEEYKQLNSGNINTTYSVVMNKDDDHIGYIVQRVNCYVFKDPEAMMNNIDLVTKFIIQKKKAQKGGRLARRERIHFHHTADGKNYYKSSDEEFWRVMNCIEDSIGYDATDDPKVLYMAGKAFGQFQVDLADFDASQLVETIPGFHNTKQRLDTFFAHVAEDPCGRCASVQAEIDKIAALRETASQLTNMLEAGELPLRVTHNDTKSNNVLLDAKTQEPLVVIDLDTVMPGLAMHDFGDAVRFAANTAVEDEKDLSKVSLNLELYRAFAEGFIGAAAGFLTQAELDTMALGAITITIELAVRFLDDYITGDKYFKVLYPEHNLVRARSQLALAEDMLRKRDEMEAIVREVAANNTK